MTLNEIKQAIDIGKRVYWSNSGYEVIKDKYQYLIVYNRGGRDENSTGLTHRDGITLNGKECDFLARKRSDSSLFIPAYSLY